MKILVTGSAGLVGNQVVKDLVESSNQTFSCYHRSKPVHGIPLEMDLTNEMQICKAIEKVKPDAIIHLGAMTDVDLCEKEKDLALKINGIATGIIAREATRHNSFLVYLSTDYVFDGETGLKRETDLPQPVDYYGTSKLEGEKTVMTSSTKWCVARTSTPFGMHPSKYNFPNWVAKNLQDKKEINVIVDQHTSPTYTVNLSRMLIEITMRQISGIIHVAGATRISRFDMAKLVSDKLSLDTKFLKPAKIADMKWWIAKRPKDSSLDVSKANSVLREKPMSIDKSVDLFIEQMRQKPN